jgi:hypothetical protein
MINIKRMNFKVAIILSLINLLINVSFQQACFQDSFDIVFVVDSSYDISTSSFAMIKQSMTAIVNNLKIGPTNTRIGILNYGSNDLKTFI